MNSSKALHILNSGLPEFEESINNTDPYLNSYPLLLRSTSVLLKELKSQSISPIAHMAYGWMPRILTFRSDDKTNALFCKAATLGSKKEALELLDELKSLPTNNSLVGVSKLLHFINPTLFPIWDSRVAKHFGVVNYQLQKNMSLYKDYISFIHDHLNHESTRLVKDKIKNTFGYEVSDVRAVELLLFMVKN